MKEYTAWVLSMLERGEDFTPQKAWEESKRVAKLKDEWVNIELDRLHDVIYLLESDVNEFMDEISQLKDERTNERIKRCQFEDLLTRNNHKNRDLKEELNMLRELNNAVYIEIDDNEVLVYQLSDEIISLKRELEIANQIIFELES